MFRIVVMLIILTGAHGLLMAQSEFVDDKESAVGIRSSFTEGPHSLNLCKLDLGVSISGRIDIGVSGETILNSPENNAGFGYSLAVFPVKQQNGGMPLSAAVDLGTLYYDKYRTRFVAVSIMRYFSLSKAIRIQPILTASLAVLDSTAWGKKDESEIVDRFSLPISVRFNNGLITFISPTLVSTEERGYVGLSLGLIMKMH